MRVGSLKKAFILCSFIFCLLSFSNLWAYENWEKKEESKENIEKKKEESKVKEFVIRSLEKDLPKKDFFEQERRVEEAIYAISRIPIQSGGRLKPFSTVAREGLQVFTGKTSLKGRAAVEVFLSILFYPKFWQAYAFFRIDHKILKDDLSLGERQYFSFNELTKKEKLSILFQSLEEKNQNKEKLDPYFQAVSLVRKQIFLFNYLVSGKLFAILPPPSNASFNKWIGLDALSADLRVPFLLLVAMFESDEKRIQRLSVGKVEEFIEKLKAKNPSLYPDMKSMDRELHYNHFRPFRISWILAIITLFFFIALLLRQKPWLNFLSIVLYILTLIVISYGFYLRIMIAGRPPVTNMYESVIWVAFACLVFGFFIYLIYKKPIIALSSLTVSILGFILADISPVVLNESIHPLEPVLRSNFWLLLHVLTITLSYAAFAFSLGIANLALSPFVFLRRASRLFSTEEMALYSYRAVQLGVVLLGAGTLLGGLWADYSWGRFWAWDPKETWALVAFLSYVALLHARHKRLLREFGFLVASIFAFLSVLMAWYGVNFILGAGLHSYGFSSGGNIPVFTYILTQTVFCFYAIRCRKLLAFQG